MVRIIERLLKADDPAVGGVFFFNKSNMGSGQTPKDASDITDEQTEETQETNELTQEEETEIVFIPKTSKPETE